MAAMALLLAAGSGERLGAGAPKAFLLLRGRPMLERSLVAIACTPSIDSVVLVVPDDRRAEAARIAAGVQPALTVEAIVVGGATRQESVRRGLDAVPDRTDVVVCHDAARPLASQELFARVIAAVAPAGRAHGAVPVVPSADTVKRIRYGA